MSRVSLRKVNKTCVVSSRQSVPKRITDHKVRFSTHCPSVLLHDCNDDMDFTFDHEAFGRGCDEAKDEVERLTWACRLVAAKRVSDASESMVNEWKKMGIIPEEEDSLFATPQPSKAQAESPVDEIIRKMRRRHTSTMQLPPRDQLTDTDKRRLEQAARLYGYEIFFPAVLPVMYGSSAPPPPKAKWINTAVSSAPLPKAKWKKNTIIGVGVVSAVIALVGWRFAKK